MNNYQQVVRKLDAMITSIEMGSGIPVQAGELKALQKLLLNDCPPGKLPDASELRPQLAPMTLFPTLDSLQSVVQLAESQLPITSSNALLGLLYTYHNTLLTQLQPN